MVNWVAENLNIVKKMKYNKLVYIIAITIFISCKEKNNSASILDSRPEAIDVFNSKLNGYPIISNKSEILQNFGKPSIKKQNCVIFSNLKVDLNETIYDCWIYDKITKFGFDTFGELGYLSYVSFNNSDIKIEFPEINLTKTTTLKEISRVFPKAFNLKITDYNNGYDIISLNDNLIDSSNEFANIIELGFDNGILKYYNYQIEPEYITELDN